MSLSPEEPLSSMPHLNKNGVQISHQEPIDRFIGDDGEPPDGGRVIADVPQAGQASDIAEIHMGKPEWYRVT